MRIRNNACAVHFLRAGLAISLLAPPTAADLGGVGLPHVSDDQRHPRACRPDDARCLALQRDVCDPWNVTATDKCTFVQLDEHCMEDANRINYLALFYCNNKVLMIVAGVAWMVILFVIMTITAEIFLCPAIEYLAARMGMAPDIAGVTLFAFASGAPDLFTQVAALAAGDHVDIELAVSATFGSGLFIICVVFAAVILAGNDDLAISDRRSYSRDASAYMVATLATLLLLCLGKLTAVDGIFLIAGYFVYLGICLGTRNSSGEGGGNTSKHQYAHPSHALATNVNLSINDDAGLDDAELEMIPFTLEISSGPGSNLAAAAAAATGQHHLHQQQQQQFPVEVMIPKYSGPSKEPSISLSPGKSSKLRPRTAGGGVGDFASVVPPPTDSITTQQITPLVNPSFQRSTAPSVPPGAGGNVGSLQQWCSVETLKEAAAAWWRDLPSILEETLHLHGKTKIRRYLTYAMSPSILFMHATMPTLHSGHTFSMAYAAVVALIAPPFFLVTAFMGPAALGGSVFVAVSSASTFVLLTLAFVVHPLESPAQFPSRLILPSSQTKGTINGGSLGGDASATISTLKSPPLHNSPTAPLSPSFAAALQPAQISTPSIFTGQRPRRCIFFALLAFLQCILWLNATAEEVVSIFEAIGRIGNVRRDTLGATVLTWGETIPDLVAVLSLSKAGQGTMAIAACFGGPVFNLLVAMGGPIFIASTRTGAIPYQMTSGVVVLVIFTIAVLVGLLLAVPLRYKWKLQRELGWVLLGVYAVSQVIFLLAEGVVL